MEHLRAAVVVLGMHRSGTSAMARVVNLLGVLSTDPSDLMPADEGNRSGYWESKRLVDFNDQLLRAAWSTWSSPPELGDVLALAEEADRVHEAHDLLDEIRVAETCVIKDPRMCILLPFWRRALPEDLVLVIVNRNPVEVARSLSARHGLGLSHGLALWEHYTRSMVRASAGNPAFIVDYDRMLNDTEWIDELHSMLHQRGAITAGVANAASISRFLDGGQRHFDAGRLDAGASCSRAQAQMFETLSALNGLHDSFAPGLIDGSTPWVDELLSSRRGLYVADRRLRVQHEQLQAKEEQLTQERRGVDESNAEIETLRAALDDAHVALHEAEASSAEVERLRAALDEAERSSAAALDELKAARVALETVRASTSWRVSAPVRALAPLRRGLSGRLRTGGLRMVVDHVQRRGIRATANRALTELRSPHDESTDDYQLWIKKYDTLQEAERTRIATAITHLTYAPLISIVMPVYNTDPRHLRRAVESVRHQLYPHWQLCMADDASTDPDTRALLRELQGSDNRITVVWREENGGIAEATNSALDRVDGDFGALFDHDAELAPTAIYAVAEALERNPKLDIMYSDEDKIDDRGCRFEPYFKPDYNTELLLAQNYFNHLTVVRQSLVDSIGGLGIGLEGSQDHDLVLRLVEATSPERISHLPYVLYHWRQYGGATSFSRKHSHRAAAAGMRAVQEHLARIGEEAVVSIDPRTPGWLRVRWPTPTPPPAVTAVIPTRDRLPLLKACVEGLLHRTNYPGLRILVVDNDSAEPATLRYLDGLRQGERTDVLRVPGPFNYSAINNRAVEKVTTPLVLLLNNDIDVEGAEWLDEMVSLAVRDGVGAVGAKLYYGNGTVQHAGVVLGIGGVAGHAQKYQPSHETGYFGRLVLTQEVSAVTGACLLTHTDLWHAVGGLDEQHLAVAFNDVDYCLRIREAGYRVLWAANAELRHLESVSRGREETAHQVARFNREVAWMKRRWDAVLRSDPMYNPNLTDVHEDFSLAHPPRTPALGAG